MASNKLFSKRNSVINIELIADFKELIENKYRYNNDLEMSGQLLFDGMNFDISIRTGGKSRLSDCLLPPLKLKFKKKQIQGTIFENQQKLKLVTHCDAGYSNKVENELVYREYKYYQRYQKKTEFHLKTQLVKVRYTDIHHSDFGLDNIENLAFFLEHSDSVEKRTKSQEIKFKQFHNRSDLTYPDLVLDQKHYRKIRNFNLLILNNDWGIEHHPENFDFDRQNIKLFMKDEIAYPVPYDFDRSFRLLIRFFAIYHSNKFFAK